MTWAYRSEPRNLTRPEVAEVVRDVLNSSSSIGSYAPRSIPQTAVRLDMVTALPPAAEDGQEVYYLADAAAGRLWHLRYRRNGSPTYPWEVLSASPLIAEVVTSETTTSTSYTDLATDGPTITLPLAGDYDVTISAQSNQSAADFAVMSYAIGATAADDADQVQASYNSANERQHNTRTRPKTGLPAGDLTAKYRVGTAGTATFAYRTISATPVRVG